MSETAMTEQTTAQVPEPAPVSEVEPAEPAQDATARPRIPRVHCAC